MFTGVNDPVMKNLPIFVLLLFITLDIKSQESNPSPSYRSTILWQIRDTVHQTTSYLLGTYHQLGNHFVDAFPLIKTKLLESDIAIFESVDTIKRTDVILDRPEDFGYRTKLSSKYLDKIEALATGWKYPLSKLTPTEVLAKLQQDYYRTHCGNVLPDDTWNHFDDYLMSLARKAGTQLIGLETDSLMVRLINENTGSLDWKSAKKILYLWIDACLNPNDDPTLCAFAYRYHALDLEYAFDISCPDDVLVHQRNMTWMQQLPDLLQRNHCFIAVGFLHLTRNCGLIAQLKQRGFAVDPVSLD